MRETNGEACVQRKLDPNQGVIRKVVIEDGFSDFVTQVSIIRACYVKFVIVGVKQHQNICDVIYSKSFISNDS